MNNSIKIINKSYVSDFYEQKGIEIDYSRMVIRIKKSPFSTRHLYNMLQEVFDEAEMMDIAIPIRAYYNKFGKIEYQIVNGWVFKYGSTTYKDKISEFVFIEC